MLILSLMLILVHKICMSQVYLELFETSLEWKPHQWNPQESRTPCIRPDESGQNPSLCSGWWHLLQQYIHIFSPPALLQSVERCSEQNYENRSQLSKFEDLPCNQITILVFQAPKKLLYLDLYLTELLMSSSTSFGFFDLSQAHYIIFEMNRVKFGYFKLVEV